MPCCCALVRTASRRSVEIRRFTDFSLGRYSKRKGAKFSATRSSVMSLSRQASASSSLLKVGNLFPIGLQFLRVHMSGADRPCRCHLTDRAYREDYEHKSARRRSPDSNKSRFGAGSRWNDQRFHVFEHIFDL